MPLLRYLRGVTKMPKSIDVPVMWKISQAVKETGLTEFTIRQALKSGRIRYIRLGAGKKGKILLNAQSLCEYMAGCSNEGND